MSRQNNSNKLRHRVLASFFGTPLALSEDKRTEIRTFLEAWEQGIKLDMSPFGGQEQQYSENYEVINGVAIMPVQDVIGPRMNMLMYYSGGTSVEMLSKDFMEARDRSDVRAIVFDCDTPGGDASNLANLSDLIFEARAIKPIIAVINPSCYSGGYWIASAASKVLMASSTAGAGSIGVVIEHRDVSGRDKLRGVVTTEIYSGKYKRIASSYKPLTEDGQAYLQDRADYVYSLFVDEIARNRGVSTDTVLKSMADGKIVIGQQAVDAGLADGIESLDSVIKNLQANPSFYTTRISGGSGGAQGGNSNMKTDAGTGTQPELIPGSTLTLASLKSDYSAIYQAAFDEGAAAGATKAKGENEAAVTAAVEAAVAGERSRIGSIMAISHEGFEGIIKAAIEDGKSTAADTALKVLNAQSERGVSLDKLRKDGSTVPHVAGDGGTGTEENDLVKNAKARAAEADKNKGGK